MKKLLTLVAIAGMFAFTACGPSKEEKEAAAKATQDSIAQAETVAAEAAAAAAAAETAAPAADSTAATAPAAETKK
jgi:hypothetical protein